MNDLRHPWRAIRSPSDCGGEWWVQGEPDADGFREIVRVSRTLRPADAEAVAEFIVNAEALMRAAGALVMNASLGPDAAMDGATDCYHVPTDDVDDVREILRRMAGRRQAAQGVTVRSAKKYAKRVDATQNGAYIDGR